MVSRTAVLMTAVIGIVLAVGFLFWQEHHAETNTKRDVNSYIACLNSGGNNTTCTQLGK